MAFTSAATVNTISDARFLATQLKTSTACYRHESHPVFGSGKVIGHIIRLSKKDHRGVAVGSAILRDEDAKDFRHALSLAKNDQQVQWLIASYFEVGH